MENNEKKDASGETSNEIIPQQGAIVKQIADIDGFIAKRQEFIQKVSAICVEGKDYHIIQGKKSLAKGGAEKIASIFQWNANFEKDTESIEMLGEIPGLVSFKCTLRKGTKYVGEGRGAATLSKNSNDPNKTLKMAQKSAFIDATLRASGLSDFFTQDLEDMNSNEIQQLQTNSAPKATEKQKEFIASLMNQKSVTLEIMAEDGITAGTPPSEVIKYLLAFKTKANTDLGETDDDIPGMDQEISAKNEYEY